LSLRIFVRKVINLCLLLLFIFRNNNMDDLIKEIIHKKFPNNTIIRIASWLDSVMDCDKIIVLECGHIVEFGHPYELIQTSRGYFRSFLDESGYVKAMNLIKIAEKNYFLTRNSAN
jgi:ATP-binding cassette, subfamily C (CFTR/MRP), member 4